MFDRRTVPAVVARFGKEHRRRRHLLIDRLRSRPRVEGLETRCLLAGGPTIAEFPTTATPTSGGSAAGITTGPDGNLWFTDPKDNKIGMINPSTHKVTEFSVPTPGAGLDEITTGPDGDLWFNEVMVNKIGQINPKTHSITEYAVPNATGALLEPYGITQGPDGNIWFTESGSGPGAIETYDPATDQFSAYDVPSSVDFIPSQPDGIATGPDGNIWFTDTGTDSIGVLDVATNAISEYPLLFSTTPALPLAITAGPDGNLWFTISDAGGDEIGTINVLGRSISEVAIPSHGYATDITEGPDGDLWFTESTDPVDSPTPVQIGEIDPSSMAISEFQPPTANADTDGITPGPDGNVWFTEGVGAIGVAVDASLDATPYASPNLTAGGDIGYLVVADFDTGGIDTDFNGPVTVALAENPTKTTLGGTTKATAKDGTVAFTDLTIDKAATGYELKFSGDMTDATTGSFSVVAGSASKLVLATPPPSSVTAGNPFGLTIDSEDKYGNLATSFDAPVTIGLVTNPTGATLNGSLTATAQGGVAAFPNLSLDAAANGYVIEGTGGGLGGVETGSLTVTPAPAAYLVASGPSPGQPSAGADFTVTVSAEDAYGNLATGYTGNVTIALANNPGQATLGGPTTVAAVQGVATFTLSLSAAGDGYTLLADGPGLPGSQIGSIDVTSASNPGQAGDGGGGPPTPITISGEQVIVSGKGRHGHLTGFRLVFSNALAAASAANPGDYTVLETSKRKSKKVVIQSVSVVAPDIVNLMISGKPRFAQGGMIEVSSPTSAPISDTQGTPLSGRTVFTILPKGRGVQ